jgi:hypothetical protein
VAAGPESRGRDHKRQYWRRSPRRNGSNAEPARAHDLWEFYAVGKILIPNRSRRNNLYITRPAAGPTRRDGIRTDDQESVPRRRR